MHPPSFPNFLQLGCCLEFWTLVCQILCKALHTTNCFGILLGPIFPVFHHRLQSVNLIKHWSWTLFTVGLEVFLCKGNLHLEATLTLFLIVFFDYEIIPGLSFWLLTVWHKYSPYFIKLADYYMDFQIVSGDQWFQSIFKLCKLGGGNLHQMLAAIYTYKSTEQRENI